MEERQETTSPHSRLVYFNQITFNHITIKDMYRLKHIFIIVDLHIQLAYLGVCDNSILAEDPVRQILQPINMRNALRNERLKKPYKNGFREELI